MHVSFPDWSILASFSVPVKSHQSAVVSTLQARADAVGSGEKMRVTEIDLARKRKPECGAQYSFVVFLPRRAPHEEVRQPEFNFCFSPFP